jgi:hypothetical protein
MEQATMKGIKSIHKLGVVLSVAITALVFGGEPSPKPGKSATTTGFQRVKVKLGQNWLTLEAIGQSARTALKERNLIAPDEISPVFDFFPGEKAFVRVMFGQGIGKRCWSVEFDREGKVLEVVTAITDG